MRLDARERMCVSSPMRKDACREAIRVVCASCRNPVLGSVLALLKAQWGWSGTSARRPRAARLQYVRVGAGLAESACTVLWFSLRSSVFRTYLD